MFWFNWEAPNCENPTTSPAYNSISGSTLKARNATSDFCLIQMNSTPPSNYNVYYNGWSRSTTTTPSATCIHHPDGDIKKISHSTSISQATFDNVISWKTIWTSACTEGGSSGSPLFDNNHRIIGQLYGGYSACGAPASDMWDVYGRFDLSWATGSTTATRLKEWLDPANSNVSFLDGYDPNVIVVDLDVQLQSITQPIGVYMTEGNVIPTLNVRNPGITTLTYFTAKYKIDNGDWIYNNYFGSLATGATTTITFPEVALTLGNHTITANVDNPNGGIDENLANNDKSGIYSVVDCGSSINTYPFIENFESGAISSCWTQDVNETQWSIGKGNGTSNPSTSHSGTNNLIFKDNTTSPNVVKLILTPFDLTSLSIPKLKFWHTQQSWSGDQDILTIYYKTSLSGNWIQLAQYTSSVISWTQEIVDLPNPTSEYYIAFEGNAKYGYGICIDDIDISDYAITPFLNVTPSISNVGFTSGTINISVASNVEWTASSNQSWCVLSNNSGNGNASISATYEANTGFARTATLSFNSTDLNTIEIVVNQSYYVSLSELAERGINIYPNPTTEKIAINFNNIESAEIKVIDLTGKVIYQNNFENSSTLNIDLSSNPAGIYIIQIKIENEVFNTQIIKK